MSPSAEDRLGRSVSPVPSIANRPVGDAETGEERPARDLAGAPETANRLPASMPMSTDGSTPQVDVPSHHYAVQVIAYRSREELDAFIAEHRLKDMLTATTERGGRTFHVPLASIHPGRASAELAATRLPAPLASITP